MGDSRAIIDSLQNRFKSCSSPLSGECCIYRVPPQLRVRDEAEYTPKIVSIGPIHHGRKGLEVMEEYKPRVLKDFLERTKISLEKYVTFIKNRETKLRDCYADPIGFSSDKFVEIMAVDVGFFMELLLEFQEGGPDYYCRMFKRPHKIFNILKDAMLLENQIPLFVLKDLFDFANIREKKPNVTFLECVWGLIYSQWEIKSMGFNPEKVVLNVAETFLDCIWIGCSSIAGELQSGTQGQEKISYPTASQLHQAGMKLEGSGRHILDIEYKDGVLSIPTMFLHDDTRTLFKNLIAFEQGHNLGIPIYTDYFSFMAQLVSSPQDIDVLVDSEILYNKLGDSVEAANAFKNFVRGTSIAPISVGRCRYRGICEQLSRYYKTSHPGAKETRSGTA